MKMTLLDAHNDAAYRMYFEPEAALQADFGKIKQFQALLVYAIFMDPEKMIEFSTPMAYFEALYEHFLTELAKHPEQIEPVTSAKTLAESKKQQAMLAVEGGSLITSPEAVDYLWEKGIRILTLTWNDSNKIAKSQMSKESGGLSPFGREVVRKMNRLGMLADLSHASDETFWDVLSVTEKPVLVSHSNARYLCNHPRNVTDEMFRALMENGGVLGINFYPPFLGENADISTIFSHIEHFLDLDGEHHIGFGSDFDGVDCLPRGIEDISSFETIYNEMEKRNYPTNLIENIFYKNMMRILS